MTGEARGAAAGYTSSHERSERHAGTDLPALLLSASASSLRRLVAIEGLGPSPKAIAERGTKSMAKRMREWVDEQRKLSGRLPRRYPTIEDAFKRMQEENKHLSAEQARHLTQQGVNQNEDGTYSWKFDNYVRVNPPYDMSYPEIEKLWTQIACP